jgi:hypothetical protein
MRALRGIFSSYHRKLKYKSYNFMDVPNISCFLTRLTTQTRTATSAKPAHTSLLIQSQSELDSYLPPYGWCMLLILQWIQLHYIRFFTIGKIVGDPAHFDCLSNYMVECIRSIHPSSTYFLIHPSQTFWLIADRYLV